MLIEFAFNWRSVKLLLQDVTQDQIKVSLWDKSYYYLHRRNKNLECILHILGSQCKLRNIECQLALLANTLDNQHRIMQCMLAITLSMQPRSMPSLLHCRSFPLPYPLEPWAFLVGTGGTDSIDQLGRGTPGGRSRKTNGGDPYPL